MDHMPNRIVREGILSSERMATLAWPEEVFFRRLMSTVDDYGRGEANPQLLRSRCYPLQTDAVRVADITRWMAACQKAGLILVYEVSGKQYLELYKFQQQQRSPSKWPAPPEPDINCYQTPTDAHLVVSVSEGVIGDVSVVEGGSPRKREPSYPKPDDVDEQTWTDWKALRKAKRATVSATVIEGARGEAIKAGLSLEGFLKVWVQRGSQGLQADWLKSNERPTATSFAEQERQAGFERWEQMTGRVHPDRKQRGEVLDLLPVDQIAIGAPK